MVDLAARARAQSLRSIRESFAALGVPLDELTDEQIEEGAQEFARLVRETGVTAEQAAQSLIAALRESPSS